MVKRALGGLRCDLETVIAYLSFYSVLSGKSGLFLVFHGSAALYYPTPRPIFPHLFTSQMPMQCLGVLHRHLLSGSEKQNPRDRTISGVLKGLARQCPTFTGNTTNYHRPKSVSLSCSEWEGVVPLRYGRRAKGFDSKLTLLVEFFAKRSKALRAAFAVFLELKLHQTISLFLLNFLQFRQHGYRIKPHGQLVSVRFKSHNSSTPDLSTSSSQTTLQWG